MGQGLETAGEVEGARGAVLLLCGFAFSLASMQPGFSLFGFTAVGSDLIFAALAIAFPGLVLGRRVNLVSDPAFLFVGLYFAAMLVSGAGSGGAQAPAAKLVTQVYLTALPVLACCLIRTEASLRMVVCAWLAGTALVVLVGAASLAVFAVDPLHPLLDYTRFPFGTLRRALPKGFG